MDKISWFYLVSFLYFLRIACTLLQPVFFLFLLRYFVNPQESLRIGFGYVVGIFLFSLCSTLFDHRYQWQAQRAAIRVRAGLMSAIYKKALKLSVRSDDQSGISKWVSAMSVDAENVKNFVEVMGNLFFAPLEVIGIVGILYSLVGVAAFVGLGIMLVSVFASRFIGAQISVNGRKRGVLTGQRTTLLSEVINGAKAIKFFAWESEFIRKIQSVRVLEEKALR